MVMAYIWTGMVLTAVLFSFWSGAGGVLSQAVLEGAQAGVTLTLSMAGAVCLWSGVGRVMECAGLNRILARFLGPELLKVPGVSDRRQEEALAVRWEEKCRFYDEKKAEQEEEFSRLGYLEQFYQGQ